MNSKQSKSLARWGAVLAGAFVAASVCAGDVTTERLISSEKEPGNWLSHHGNLEAHRFSGLDQINTKNVKKLRLHLGDGRHPRRR
jgi:alcohol dehydrogenase (cytochrome c)